MKKFFFRVCLTTCAALFILSAFAQTKTNTEILREASVKQAEKERIAYQKLQVLAREKGWSTIIKRNGGIAVLVGVDELGMPEYLTTYNNITAAATIGTNKVWPGGSTGLNLNGSSNSVKGKLAIWDGGNIRATHVELVGRILQKDDAGSTSDHSTHVAGTMIAAGINPLAKGMAFGQQQLIAYNFLNGTDNSEMMAEANNLLVSNHSYGTFAGWTFNNNRWEFYGPVGSTEDFKFGYYSSGAQLWDSIAWNAPNYLIVKAAGNSRDENGPPVGETYWRMNAANQFVSAPRPAGISNNDSYDILSSTSNAKNILLVGAINPIPGGYTNPADVVLSSFTSWGPTDDGRIKPDVVADGVGVLSSVDASDNAYEAFDGTSMSTPNVSGSLILLQEYWAQLHPPSTFMRSATLKGLVIHTADEAGDAPGPDYKMGWGLVNIAKAATVITNNGTKDLIEENVLNQGGTKTYNVIASGDGTITATLSWTDPKASVETPGTATALNNPNVKLVDDLDIVVKKGATVYRSWILNPVNRDNAATRGNNTLDNVEKVEVPDVVPGDAYTIEITHKGTLERGTQAYSVIVSGIGGKAYCTSAPSVNTGSRIDSVSFTNIKNKNAAGCTSYSNFTNLIGNVEAGQAFPLFIRLNSCDATAVDKIVKVFIDANNDGDFDDAGEILATSPVLNGDQDYTPTITLPSSLSVGKYTVLRIVAQETNTATAVTPCGTYTKGETQDYRVQVTTPSNDVGIAELVSPQPADCASGAQFVAVRIRNYGNTLKTNVPVSAVIKQGATTVNTFNAIFAGKIPANSSVVYVFQQPFIAAPGTAYMITTSTSLAGDQNVSNNQNITSVTTSPSSTDPSGTAVICGTTAQLKATPATDIYTWYNSAAATVPIASGSNTVTATILPTYFLARNENNLSIGPANKDLFPSGNYNEFQNFFMVFNNTVPVTIETVRFYIGNANSTGKLQLILGRNFSVSGGTINFLPEGIVDLDIYATDPTPAPGMQPNDPTDQGAVFYVHLPVPVTGDHMLMIHNPSNTDLTSMYRNNLITTSPYPVGISGLFTFTDNYVTYATPPDNFQAFYYFFYDLRLKLQGCPAPARKTITATTTPTPSITLVGNVFTSSEAAGNQWLKDGFSITGQTGQTFTATESGNYSTQVTNANGCVLNSNNINFVATAIPTVDPSRIGLVVSPVPARKDFSIQLEVNTKADLDISLISTSGQTVYHSATPDFIGRFNKTINTGTVGAGVYYLQVIHDRKKYIRKVVIIQ